MSDKPKIIPGIECTHRWSGGEDFRFNRQICGEEIALFNCVHCGARTWLTRPQWNKHRGTWKKGQNK